MASAYEYQSLAAEPHGTIRLLKLRPDKALEQIICHLQLATVEDDFTAISYVWGTDPATERISVDDQPFYVRQNLYQGLFHIRDGVSEKLLWIDAICVNQADLRERSSQVMLMGQIFGKATLVLAWLGVNSAHKYQLPECEDLVGYYGHPTIADAASILGDLFNQPYWFRMWIVQEIVLAKTLKLQYGNHQVDWEDLIFWSEKIDYSYQYREHYSYGHRQREVSSCWKAIYGRRIFAIQENRDAQQNGVAFDLKTLWDWYRDRTCADRRDKIISLLGLSLGFHGIKQRADNANLYEMSERRLCEHVARRYECRNEDLLRELGILLNT